MVSNLKIENKMKKYGAHSINLRARYGLCVLSAYHLCFP
jgi:hypothetical protein